MTLITVYARKGGVAKTTTAVTLASALAHVAPTLLVDGDPQGQCTLHYGLPMRAGVAQWLMGHVPLVDCVYHARPSNLLLLAGDSHTEAAEVARAGTIGERLQTINTRFVVLDTGGRGRNFQDAALTVSDQIVIPFRPEATAIDSLFVSMKFCREANPNAHLTLLPVMYDGRLKIHRDTMAALAEVEELRDMGVDETYAIRQRVAVVEAATEGKTIWEWRSPSLAEVKVGYIHLFNRVIRLDGYPIHASPATFLLGGSDVT
jgi:chromosome partitioning protein